MTSPSTIVTLDDVKDFLGIQSSQTKYDPLLQRYINAASAWATYVSDAIVPEQFGPEYHCGRGGSKIVLFNTPILSVASITEVWSGATSYPLTQWEPGGAFPLSNYSYSLANAAQGIITRIWNGFEGPFVAGMSNNIVVTYTAGFQAIPADIQTYVLMDIQGLFVGGQQGGRPDVSGVADFEYSGSSTGVPLNAFPRLASLMTSSRRVPAIG